MCDGADGGDEFDGVGGCNMTGDVLRETGFTVDQFRRLYPELDEKRKNITRFLIIDYWYKRGLITLEEHLTLKIKECWRHYEAS